MNKTKYIKSGIYYETEITVDREGRTSIIVKSEPFDYRGNSKTLVDIELPNKTGDSKDAFKPIVRVNKGLEIEIKYLKSLNLIHNP